MTLSAHLTLGLFILAGATLGLFILAGATLGLFILAGATLGLFILGLFILAGATLGLFILAGAVRGLFILGQFVQAGATLGLFIQGVDDPLLEQAGAIIVDGISRALGMWSRVVDLALFCSRIRITGPFAPPFSTTPLDSHDGIACMDEVCFCERLVFKALREVA